MAKVATSPITIDHSSDAGYRAWAAAFLNVLDTINPSILTRTADTGQINTSTATRPSINTIPDYAVYKFDDGIGLPIYIRFSLGTGNATSAPAMAFIIGKSTNGAGVISDQFHAISGAWSGSNVAQTGPVLSCVIQGHFSLLFGQGIMSNGTICFGATFTRSADSNGNPTADGLHGMIKQWSSGTYSFFTADMGLGLRANIASETGVTAAQLYGRTTTAAGGVVKPLPVFYLTPDARVSVGMLVVDIADAAMNAEFSLPMVGTTPRNYKVLGFNTTQKAYATLWE